MPAGRNPPKIDGSVKSFRGKTQRIVGASGRSPLRVRRSEKIEAQCRKWTFYQNIIL
jgi:hypothetical protein